MTSQDGRPIDSIDPVWLPPVSEANADWLAWANGLPLFRALGMVCLSLDEASGDFLVPETPMVPNPNGSVNGGLVVTLADQVMGILAVRSSSGRLPATAALHSQFHRPAFAPLTLRGCVLGGGRRIRYIEVVTFARDGKRCATSQGTMIGG